MIVDRRVNVGQTVVSTMSVSSLFLIAKDLKRIQVWASVNEADIGRIHEGMPVTFTVDAYPQRGLPRHGLPDPPERHNDAERGHLHRGGGHRQFRLASCCPT